jgi:hypothetical protein
MRDAVPAFQGDVSMSILDKYPAPWVPMRHGPECTAYDAAGTLVCEIGDGELGREDLQRLILAAPDLLAALGSVLGVIGTSTADEPIEAACALIARIEGK